MYFIMQNHKLRNELRESYDKHAQERESSAMQEWKIGERSNFLLALQTDNKQKVLEIGAGTGRDSRYFQDQGLEVVCIDLSPAMVELCRQTGLTAFTAIGAWTRAGSPVIGYVDDIRIEFVNDQ